MRQAAILGKPVSSALSPVLHRAAYRALGLEWAYHAIECDEIRARTRRPPVYKSTATHRQQAT